jgi:hypothetical protein
MVPHGSVRKARNVPAAGSVSRPAPAIHSTGSSRHAPAGAAGAPGCATARTRAGLFEDDLDAFADRLDADSATLTTGPRRVRAVARRTNTLKFVRTRRGRASVTYLVDGRRTTGDRADLCKWGGWGSNPRPRDYETKRADGHADARVSRTCSDAASRQVTAMSDVVRGTTTDTLVPPGTASTAPFWRPWTPASCSSRLGSAPERIRTPDARSRKSLRLVLRLRPLWPELRVPVLPVTQCHVA